MAKRKIFTSFSVPPLTGESKEEEHTVSPPLTAKRLQVVPVETSTLLFQPIKNLAGMKIEFSVTSINELAQHSYSHVIRNRPASFHRAGNGE
jgi:hypothetical protein